MSVTPPAPVPSTWSKVTAFVSAHRKTSIFVAAAVVVAVVVLVVL